MKTTARQREMKNSIYNQPNQPGEKPVQPITEPDKEKPITEPEKPITEPDKEKPTVPNREKPFTHPDKEIPAKDPGKDEPLVQPQSIQEGIQ